MCAHTRPAARVDSLSGSNHGHWFGDLSRPSHITLGQHTNGSGVPRQSGHEGAFGDILIYDHPLTASERSQLHLWIRHKYHTAADDDAAPPATGGMPARRSEPSCGGRERGFAALDKSSIKRTTA